MSNEISYHFKGIEPTDGIKEHAENEIAKYSDFSLETLSKISGEEDVKAKLSALVHYLIDREN